MRLLRSGGSAGRFAILAIPILHSRVAPVLNWCSRIYLFPEDPAFQGPGREMNLSRLEAEERLSYLKDQGVTTLICGALSPDLLHQGERLGLVFICGVAGEVGEVLTSYWQNGLNQPRFRLPGCRVGRYRHNFRGLHCPEVNGSKGGKKPCQEEQGGKEAGDHAAEAARLHEELEAIKKRLLELGASQN